MGAAATLQIGAVRVHHVEEWQGNFMPPSTFFVGYDETAFRAVAPSLTPDYYRADADSLYAFLQSWLLEVDGLKVLYDTGAGNAKERPGIPLFGGLDTPFLQRLAATGITPEQVDVVICSHLHIDHVGWNTRLQGDAWVPTFPNARHLFSAIERDYWDPRGPGPRPTAAGVFVNTNVFEDSVQPLLDSGRAELVSAGHQVSESITLQMGPGHTPGHLIMDVRSRGESALFVGDILHHPIQVYYPEWNSPFCEDQPQARVTRRRVLNEAAERGAMLVPAHFGGAHYCRVRRAGDAFEPYFEAT
jgi:glyoxylase-like metal-dependent hydrolase (beta-lactamase superfamily II)